MKITTTHLAKSYLAAVEGKSEKEVAAVAKRFAVLLKQRGLLKNKRAILAAIEEAYDAKEGHRSVTVTSAHKLTGEEAKSIEKGVKTGYNVSKVTLTNAIDESLIAGVDIEIGWDKISNSLKARLETLKKAV